MKKKSTRLRFFSVVINVRGAQKENWQEMKKNEIPDLLQKYNFPDPANLSKILADLEGVAQRAVKPGLKTRFFKISDFKGQLEQGTDNMRPHYNIAVELTCQCYAANLAQTIALSLYGINDCPSIQVKPSVYQSALMNYCSKTETRLVLPETKYYPPTVDIRLSEFLDLCKEDEDLKKLILALGTTNWF